MLRRAWMLLPVLTLACSRPAPDPEPLFPATAGGRWTLKESREQPLASAPESVRSLNPKAARSATYEGAGTLAVTVYEFSSETVAFEAEQKWRPVADTGVFHRGRWFAVLDWSKGERNAVQPFVGDLTKRLSARQ